MSDEDYSMGEDYIVNSTELNGDLASDTVDPAEIFANFKSQPLPKNEQLPFHGPLKDASLHPPTFQLNESNMYHAAASPGIRDNGTEPATMLRRRSSPQVRIPPAPRSMALPYVTSRTGLVYDPRMRFHSELPELASHADDIHPEDPRRIHSIFEEIRQAGLVRGPESSDDETNEKYCWRIGIRPAEKHEILTIHTESHYNFIESLQHMPIDDLRYAAERLDSIYFNRATYECAKLAVGGAIEACKAVVQGAVRNAIAIIRPPGHHAESSQPSGFCIFNNVPIAARVCQDAFPQTCRKILILDWDVHHGNGIQHAFYDDPNVLYISLHVYLDGNFYPNLPDGNLDYVGEGAGVGRNVNIPWPDHGMGDAEYIYAFQELVMPIATEFDPDLVIISAGFDAAEGDLLGGCFVTPACYGHMTHMLMRLAKGKVVVCLEGGYNLRSIARSALAVTRVLMLEPPDRLSEDLAAPKEKAVRTIQQVKRKHSRYWKCLYPKDILDKTDPGYQALFGLHKIIREWQSQCLAKEHCMTPLQISKAPLSHTFEHNVIATPNFTERKPLLVIFHDPPNFQDHADPTSGHRDLHNTWLTDVTKSYIDWAIRNDFQVIDVNIPKIVTVENEEPDVGYTRSDDSSVRAHQTRELATYIWENYIEPHDATQVFFMGIGDAYLGLVDLLSLNENCTERGGVVECLIGFVAETMLQSIKRATDDQIAQWYYDHSRIFVKNRHYVWSPERQRKRGKKLGSLVQSSSNTLDEMLDEHREEVQDLLLSRRNTELEDEDTSSPTDDGQQAPATNGLRSPFRATFATPSVRQGSGSVQGSVRQGSVTGTMQSPKMPGGAPGPPVGLFHVGSPKIGSPRSPMKRGV